LKRENADSLHLYFLFSVGVTYTEENAKTEGRDLVNNHQTN